MTPSSRAFRIHTIVLAGISAVLYGCSPKEHDQLVAKVGADPVTLSQYETMYLKSNTSREIAAASSMEERERFLDLMVKYRLKLADAYRTGLDRRPDVVSELEQYKGSLASSFLTERDIVTPGIRRMYERRSEEIRASHILLELSQSASAADSSAAYAKAYELVAKLKGGADFGTLAVENSKDPSVSRNKGDLYYFTGGQMVPAFEDAAYALKVGEVTPYPIRTQYGLHIIKLTDRKAAPGEMHCSHIMVRFSSPSPSPEDTTRAYSRILALRDSLAAGTDFAELATRNSEDPGSAPRGGDLGWFTRRRWIQPFDEAAFALRPGQVSGIVRTVYGYHLIKCYESRPVKSFDESRQELLQMYQQQRFQDDSKTYVEHLMQSIGVRRDSAALGQLYASLDTVRAPRDSAWAAAIPENVRRSPVLWVANKPVTADSVVGIIKGRPDLSLSELRRAQFMNAVDKVVEQLVYGIKADQLRIDNQEFAGILQEYKEGILLYQAEQENIWSKIQPNDSLLLDHFNANRDKFTYPDRVKFASLRCASDAAARRVHTRLIAGATMDALAREDSARMQLPWRFQVEFKKGSGKVSKAATDELAAIAAQMKADSTLQLRITSRPDTANQKAKNLKLAGQRTSTMVKWLTARGGISAGRIITTSQPRTGAKGATIDSLQADITGRTSLIIGKPEQLLLAPSAEDRAKQADSLAIGTYSLPFFSKSAYYIVRLDSREPARRKTFEEAGAEVSTSFQDYESKRLENLWLTRLRTEFPVTEYKDVLSSAFAPPAQTQ